MFHMAQYTYAFVYFYLEFKESNDFLLCEDPVYKELRIVENSKWHAGLSTVVVPKKSQTK